MTNGEADKEIFASRTNGTVSKNLLQSNKVNRYLLSNSLSAWGDKDTRRRKKISGDVRWYGD